MVEAPQEHPEGFVVWPGVSSSSTSSGSGKEGEIGDVMQLQWKSERRVLIVPLTETTSLENSAFSSLFIDQINRDS